MQRRHFLKTAAIPLCGTLAVSTLLSSQSIAQANGESNPKINAIRGRIKPITNEERAQRIENARKLMTENGIDALLFEGGTSLSYFTGVSWGRSERLFAMVLPRTGEPQFIAPKFEELRAAELVGSWKLLTWNEHESPYPLVHRIMQDAGLATGTLGIEETTRSFVTEGIARAIPGGKIASGTVITAGCRSVKSAHEIELMQIANDITAEVFKSAVSTLREGMKENELAAIISKGFSQYGVGGGALVLFGEASAFPHGTKKEHVLRDGDIVLIDGGCSVEGYASDITRTTVFGKPSEKMQKMWQIVRDAQSAALAVAKPGVTGEAIDAAARKVIDDASYGPDYKYFTHRLGHGIGMDGHEWHYLVRGNTRPEQAGNMYSNEPGIYIVGEFGIRLEDEMLITADGAKLLLPQAPSLGTIF